MSSSLRVKLLLALSGLSLIIRLPAANLHLLPPDAGLIAASDVSSNVFIEGTTRGSMTKYYWDFGPSFGWQRTVTEIASNGLFRVDYSVFRGERSRPPSRPDLSVLFFRPPLRGATTPTNQVDWDARLAERLAAQREKIRGIRNSTLRAPRVLQALEDTLSAARFFSANAERYRFSGTNDEFSFTAELPRSFPGVLETGGLQSRRVRVFLEPQPGPGSSLVLEHTALPLDGFVEPFRVPLARNVLWFGATYFDRDAQMWTNAWSSGNGLPGRVGVSLGLSGSGQFDSRGFGIPVVPVPPELQGGFAAGSLEMSTNYPMGHRREKRLAGPTESHAIELEWLGRSGVELARYILAEQGPAGIQFDALNQKWAGGTGDTNSTGAPIPLQDFPLGGGTISLRITDLERKANLNLSLLAPELLFDGFLLTGVDVEHANALTDAVLDWLDPDGLQRVAGAESDFYLTLNPPYYAKNGPIDDLRELLAIKGITPSIFAGLTNLFTPVSSRFMNINTASSEVMQLIPDVDGALATEIISTRAGPDGIEGNEDDQPFRSMGDLALIPGMTPSMVQSLTRYFRTRSSVFEVTVDVKLGRQARQYSAWLFRNGVSDIQILKLQQMN